MGIGKWRTVMDLANTVTVKSHATHIEIFIDGRHWTNSTGSIKKYSTYYTSIKPSQVMWFCNTHSSCLSAAGVQTHLFYMNQVTDTLLNFHSLVKHSFTLTDTFTEQQNMVQWRSPNLPCTTINPLERAHPTPSSWASHENAVTHRDTWNEKTPFNLFPGKAETECQGNFQKNWERFIYGDILYYLIL